jgi:PKD repeat protein
MKNMKRLDELMREKIDQFEFSYDPQTWARLQQDLPKPPVYSTLAFKIAALLFTAAVLTFGGWYLVSLQHPDQTVAENLKNNPSDKTVIVQNNINPQSANIAPVKENLNQTIPESPVKHNNINQTNKTIDHNQNYNPVTVTDPLNHSTSPNQVLNSTNGKSKLPEAAFTADNTEGCGQLRVKFTPLEKADSIIYSWDFGDGQFSTRMSPVHIYRQPGVYTVFLSVKYYHSEEIIHNVVQDLIVIKESPVADFTWQINEEGGYEFKDMSEGASKVKWFLGSSTIAIDENPVHQFQCSGKYKFSLVAISANGCADTAFKSVDVKKNFDLQYPNAFTPFSGDENSTFGPGILDMNGYSYTMVIINNLGQIIFETTDINKRWDGKNKLTGQMAEFGTYIFKTEVKDKCGSVLERKTGHVTMLNNN